MDEQVLVIRTERMQDVRFKNGFTEIADCELINLCSGATFILRSEAETSTEYKQLIPYSILRMGNRIFRYQRTRSGGESRLFKLFSIGVGGHINPEDGPEAQSDGYSMLLQARAREIQEEFSCQLAENPRLVGLINDDSNPVGRVHVGVVYEYRTVSDVITPNEAENFAEYGLVELAVLIDQMDRFETWSQIVIWEYLQGSIV